MSAAYPLKLIVLLAALGLAPGAATADGERAQRSSLEAATDEPAASAAPDEAADSTASAAGEADGGESSEGEEPSGDVFVPTEEISEDYAVSFPVDI